MRSVLFGVRQAMAIIAAMATLSVLAGGCALAPPVPYAGPNPADATAPLPSIRYRPTIAGYESLRPVEPAPWREQNDRIAPRR